MPSTQKQRPGHITTINHTPVLSGTLARVEEREPMLDVTTQNVKEKEREREWTNKYRSTHTPSRQVPGPGYLINYSNASFPSLHYRILQNVIVFLHESGK